MIDKLCTACNKVGVFSKNKSQKDGLHRWCNRCIKLRIKNMTPNEYEILLTSQNGACAICKNHFSYDLFIDHDHRCCESKSSCGKCIRGLVCAKCNLKLGTLEDNAWIRNAKAYLERSN